MRCEKREFTFEEWPRTINDMREALGHERTNEDRLSEEANARILLFSPRHGERISVIIDGDLFLYMKNTAGCLTTESFSEKAVWYDLKMRGHINDPVTYEEITRGINRIPRRTIRNWLCVLERMVWEMRREITELKEAYSRNIKHLMILPSAESSSEIEGTCFINDAAFERKDAPEQEDK